MEQNGLFRLAAIGILDGGVDFVKERVVIEVALGVEKRRLVEHVAGMDGDGAGYGFGPRVVQPGEQDLADKNLLSLDDAEGYVHLVGVRRLDLLADLDRDLLESPAHVGGHERIAVSGHILR